jgi:hypothetical protein
MAHHLEHGFIPGGGSRAHAHRGIASPESEYKLHRSYGVRKREHVCFGIHALTRVGSMSV